MRLLLADMILVMHALFVAFVVVGFVLIVAGGVRQWAWTRNFLFRVLHFLAIGSVAAEAWLGRLCPLTEWESTLRQSAGAAGYPGTFVQYWLQRLIFYDFAPWVFTAAYIAFAVLVLVAWRWWPPALPWRKGGVDAGG
ncbi:MAG: hypothetical protein A2521_13865 [Deltaproteobacteria bacterium RIFOXYD12_FULL_57_12]|nr:MAG: hypothetical protein A2521_13865 [Deltaproteobacteria bacterium RIFOXYD12_FULL_57_12]